MRVVNGWILGAAAAVGLAALGLVLSFSIVPGDAIQPPVPTVQPTPLQLEGPSVTPIPNPPDEPGPTPCRTLVAAPNPPPETLPPGATYSQAGPLPLPPYTPVPNPPEPQFDPIIAGECSPLSRSDADTGLPDPQVPGRLVAVMNSDGVDFSSTIICEYDARVTIADGNVSAVDSVGANTRVEPGEKIAEDFDIESPIMVYRGKDGLLHVGCAPESAKAD